MNVRCVTINLKGLDYKWFEARSEVLSQGLIKFEPDVVCYQETTIVQKTPLYNQARFIGEKLNHSTSIFCPYGNVQEVTTPDQGGIALSCRWPASDIHIRQLVDGVNGERDRRPAIFATFETPQGKLEVGGTHLAWRPEESEIRKTQAQIIVAEMKHGPCDRKILLGDFNATETQGAVTVIREFFKDTFREAHPREAGYTWDTKNPLTQGWDPIDRRVDYIFCSPSARVKRSEVILNEGVSGLFASDHFGVFCELEWTGP